MSLFFDIVALAVAYGIALIVRRYFIFTSGERKTGVPFLKDYNFITGSKDIVFTHDKVLGVNAHDRHREFGSTFGAYFGESMHIFTKDPDLVYKVCVTEFQKHRNRFYVNSLSFFMKASLLEARDNEWQTSRRAVGSVLKASKLKQDNVDTDIDTACRKMLTSIDRRLGEMKKLGDDTVLDVYQINKNFFMQSILKIIYDSDHMVDFDSDHNDVVEELHKFINVNYEKIARTCFLIPMLTHLIRPLIGFFDHGKYLGLLTQRLEKILVKTLNLSRSNPTTDASRLTTIHSLINSYKKGELTRDQLMGNAVFLMVAGYATSVDSTSALMWELAKHPKVQDKLRADLLRSGENSKYLEQCINETLRLYPGSITNRDLSDHVYHNGMRMVKGACLEVNLYSLHRDPKYWGPTANEWNPDRFDPELVAKFHPAQFIPFGIGPRNCVGYNLARLELVKYAAQFLIRYKLELTDKTQSKLNLVALGALPFALPVEGPIPLRLVPMIGAA